MKDGEEAEQNYKTVKKGDSAKWELGATSAKYYYCLWLSNCQLEVVAAAAAVHCTFFVARMKQGFQATIAIILFAALDDEGRVYRVARHAEDHRLGLFPHTPSKPISKAAQFQMKTCHLLLAGLKLHWPLFSSTMIIIDCMTQKLLWNTDLRIFDSLKSTTLWNLYSSHRWTINKRYFDYDNSDSLAYVLNILPEIIFAFSENCIKMFSIDQ